MNTYMRKRRWVYDESIVGTLNVLIEIDNKLNQRKMQKGLLRYVNVCDFT